jgi:ubiquinone/menaquinone biosynthesis C-methylase UbiE
LYEHSAPYYDELHAVFKRYDVESARVCEWIRQYAPHAQTLLDVACGTGRHLEYLRHEFQASGVDVSAPMLEIARQRCGDSTLKQGDMVDFDFGRKFDVVICLFSSIASLRTLDRVQRAIARMAYHLEANGLLIVEPWFTPERYFTNHLAMNVSDTPSRKVVWMYTTRVNGRIGSWDNHFLVGTSSGVQHFAESQEVGLFTHEEYLDAFERAGLTTAYDSKGLLDRGMYFGIKPK